MGCYWDISGNIIAKKGSIEEVKEVLKNHGIDIDEVEGEKISFSYYEFASYDMPDDLDSDLTPLVEDGEFTAKSDEDSSTSRYTYGEEPDCEESVVLEYYPSQIDDFVKTLPKDLVDAVVRAYAKPAAKNEELRVQTPAGPIVAKVMPNDEYPGIIVMNENEDGQPAAILEYSPTAFEDTKSCMQLCVYDEADPDDDPVAIYQMSKDLRAKEGKGMCRMYAAGTQNRSVNQEEKK